MNHPGAASEQPSAFSGLYFEMPLVLGIQEQIPLLYDPIDLKFQVKKLIDKQIILYSGVIS